MLEKSSGPSTVAYRTEGTRASLLDLIDNVANNGLSTIEESNEGDIPENRTVGGGPLSEASGDGATTTKAKQNGVTKLSWIEGVLIPCLLNIWGVIMFMRIGWVVGQAGIIQAILIVFASKVVTTITALSLCAICTNGEVKGGGVYFLISRALGPVYGGTIGVLFFVAQAVATSLYVIGFAESLSSLLVESGVPTLFEDPLNDIRLIGLITTVLLLGVAMIGVGWYAKCQVGLLVTLVVAMLSVLIGGFFPEIPDAAENEAAGFVGIEVRNVGPNYQTDPSTPGIEQNFFTVFAVFFPAATGVMAGANLSGDLEDPSHAIPKGTLSAIGLTFVSYVLLIVIVGFACLECADAEGETYCSFEGPERLLATGGLVFNKLIMRNVSFWSPLFYVGVFAATLSSALASLVGAPRILQSVASDALFPWAWFNFFGAGKGPNNEPIRAYVLTFVITCGCVSIAKLDIIAALISNLFMISYAFTNYACFASSIAYYPGWRPSFKYYNKWLSLFGFFLCVIVMFFMEYVTALITLVLAGSLYTYLNFLDPNVNWGAAGEARKYFSTLRSMEQLSHGQRQHVKTYRPQFLVMSGPPSQGSGLIKFVSLLRKGGGVAICADVILSEDIGDELHESNIGRYIRKGVVQIEGIATGDDPSAIKTHKDKSHSELASKLAKRHKTVIEHRAAGDEFLGNKRIWGGQVCPGAFFDAVVSDTLADGFNSLLQSAGLGLMRPNTIVLGYKDNWRNADIAAIKEYEQMIRIALASEFGLMILRDDLHLLDFDFIPGKSRIPTMAANRNERTASESKPMEGAPPRASIESQDNVPEPSLSQSQIVMEGATDSSSVRLTRTLSTIGDSIVGDTIDVWWISDDGGLTMLIPYLLTQHRMLRNKRLRVLTVTNYNVDETSKLQKTEFRMVHLLKKFRIQAEVVAVEANLSSGASDEMLSEFNEITKVPIDSLTVQEQLKTKHILRFAEVVRGYTNSNSGLVFLTLPLPDTGIPVGLYSAWLHMLSTSMPPVVFIRGSGDQVLTFVC